MRHIFTIQIGFMSIKGGIGQYFEILFLAEFHLSCKMQLLIYEYKKKNSKIPSENEEIINFC